MWPFPSSSESRWQRFGSITDPSRSMTPFGCWRSPRGGLGRRGRRHRCRRSDPRHRTVEVVDLQALGLDRRDRRVEAAVLSVQRPGSRTSSTRMPCPTSCGTLRSARRRARSAMLRPSGAPLPQATRERIWLRRLLVHEAVVEVIAPAGQLRGMRPRRPVGGPHPTRRLSHHCRRGRDGRRRHRGRAPGARLPTRRSSPPTPAVDGGVHAWRSRA